MAEFERVASIGELADGGRLSVVVDDTPVLLVRVGSNVYAIEDACSHDGQPLTDGAVAAGQIACPRHGARFDLASGKAMCMPATEGIRVFEVELRDGGIYSRPASGTVSPALVPVAVEMPIVSGHSCGCSTPASGESGTCSSAPVSEPSKAERSLDEKMLEALRQVIDPELFVNIVDLGLVYNVDLTPVPEGGTKVKIDMTMTSPMCPAGPQLIAQCKQFVGQMAGVSMVEVKIVMDPPWTPEKMSDAARDQLGIF